MTRRGKIARLPKDIREQLNQRLQNGEPAAPLADWLNRMRPVQTMLKTYFNGDAITVQNISEWKTGGYIEWEKSEEEQGNLEYLREHSEGLVGAAGGTGISDCFRALLAAKMTALAQKLCAEEDDPKKQWERLCEVNLQFSRLCRDDHRRLRTMIWQERWMRGMAELENEERKAAWRKSPERRKRLAEVLRVKPEEIGGFDAS